MVASADSRMASGTPSPLSESSDIRCVIVRGGSSRGLFFHERDLPEDRRLRDQVIMGAVGAPDPRQVDGIGGADMLLSKIAIIAKAEDADADIECEFANIAPGKVRPTYGTNCGNLLAAVALFAIDEGLVGWREHSAGIRIRNRNSGDLIIARLRGPAANLSGHDRRSGMPSTGSCFDLNFQQPGGKTRGRGILPTGRAQETVALGDGTVAQVSIVDAGALYVFVRATDVGLTGTETQGQLLAIPGAAARLEEIRCEMAHRVGLVSTASAATDATPDVPKLAFVGPPCTYEKNDGNGTVKAQDVDLVSRIMSSQNYHQAYAVTAAIATASAASIAGSVVSGAIPEGALKSGASLRIGHPSGVLSCQVEHNAGGGAFEVRSAGIMRTARRIMQGNLLIPNHCYANSG